MEETQNQNWGWIFILVIALIWSIFFQKDKYEEQTAEEWFNEYDEVEAKYQQLHDCVEPYATTNGYISADDLYYECF